MSRSQLALLQVANLAVCGSGLVYAWMRYLMEPADEWAVVNHTWQPHVQHLHVLAAPLLVFAVGMIWSAHVLAKFRNGPTNRIAGIGLTALFLPMAASGYLLQVAVDPSWRGTWMWAHVVSSLLWVLVFVAHQLRAFMSQNHRESVEEATSPVVTPFRLTGPQADRDGEPADSTGRREPAG